MRISSSAAPENVKFVECPWPKFEGKIVCHIRPVPPSLDRQLRLKHFGQTQKVEVIDQSARPGFRANPNARAKRIIDWDNAASEEYVLECCVYALGDITGPADEGGAEHVFEDDKTAAEAWGLLTKDERAVVGSLGAGSSIRLDGLLGKNEALRRWKLINDPGLLAFVSSEAARLADAVVEDERGKG